MTAGLVLLLVIAFSLLCIGMLIKGDRRPPGDG